MGVYQNLQASGRVLAIPAIIVGDRLRETRSRIPVEGITPRLTRSAREVTRMLEAQQQATAEKDFKTSKGLIKKLNARRKLITITSSASDMRLAEQLVSNDMEPHPFSSVEECQKYRLSSGEGYHKDCQATIAQSSKGRIILAPIFRVQVCLNTDEKGFVHPSDLPGNIDELLFEKPHPLTSEESGIGYISVSSKVPGTAPTLIKEELPKVTPAGFPEFTVSPMHGFTKAFDRASFKGWSSEAMRAKVIGYLTENNDPVIGFHMKKMGAYLGWVHDLRDQVDDLSKNWISANLIYNRKQLQVAQTNWKNWSALTLSNALHEDLEFGKSVRYGRCSAPIVARKAAPALQ